MPAFERTRDQPEPCATTSTTTSPWFCFHRSRRRRRSRPPREPPMPPEDADDLQEQAGALRFPSRGRERDPEQRRRGPVAGVLPPGGYPKPPPPLIPRLMAPWVTDQWAQWLN